MSEAPRTIGEAPRQHLRLEDGSVWVRPSLERDEMYGPAHKALHNPDAITHEDLRWLASAANCYFALATRPEFRNKPPMIRRALNAEPGEG